MPIGKMMYLAEYTELVNLMGSQNLYAHIKQMG